MTIVIDASAALYLFASEEGIDPFAALGLVSPALLWSEVTSVLNEMLWRNDLSSSLAGAMFDRLLAADIERRADPKLYRNARAIAGTLGWAKTYDAEYVALAQGLGAPLMTRDRRLRRGASRLITVVAPDDVVPPDPSP